MSKSFAMVLYITENESFQDAYIVITCGTWGFCYDNLKCHQWSSDNQVGIVVALCFQWLVK